LACGAAVFAPRKAKAASWPPQSIMLVILLFALASIAQTQTSYTGQPIPTGSGSLADSPGAPPFTFAVIGHPAPGANRDDPRDKFGVSRDYLRVIDWINAVRPDFVVNCGDSINTGGSGGTDAAGGSGGSGGNAPDPYWDAFLKASQTLHSPQYVVPGASDVRDAATAQVFTKRLGALYYDFMHKGVHFIVLSSVTPGSPASPASPASPGSPAQPDRIDSEQLVWLGNLLATVPAQRRYVFVNQVFWAFGNNHDAAMRRHWLMQVHPLLRQARVDAVFASHGVDYSFTQIDAVRYFATSGAGKEMRGPRNKGSLNHYLKVIVPNHADEPAAITVNDDQGAQDQDFIASHTDLSLHRLEEAFAQIEPVTRGQDKPIQRTVQVQNPSRTTEAIFRLTWNQRDDKAMKVEPAKVELTLAPGQTQAVSFTVDGRDESGQTPPRGVWDLRVEDRSVGSKSVVLAVIRRGFYLPRADWMDDRSRIVVDQPVQRTYGKPEAWSGPTDCSAQVKVIRGDGGLRVIVNVTDDKLVFSPRQPTAGDGVELCFDLRPPEERGLFGYERGVLRLAITPDPENGQSPRVDWFAHDRRAKLDAKVTATVEQGKGYTVDVFLPDKELLAKALTPGGTFGFDVTINDADGSGRRETRMTWSGINDNDRTPASFGVLAPVAPLP
ncbi:MAG: sugar-binding protein, partial [Phycisphaeraceae bacterium]